MANCCHCRDELPGDCPPGVSSCREYANWRADDGADLLSPDDAHDLMLFAGVCELRVALCGDEDLVIGSRLFSDGRTRAVFRDAEGQYVRDDHGGAVHGHWLPPEDDGPDFADWCDMPLLIDGEGRPNA